MKNLVSTLGVCLFLIAAAAANGGMPSVSVMVSDAAGKLAYKGATKSDGGFATEKLQPGNYVVQLNSKNSSLKSGHYSIIVAAGKKKVVANSVAGEKFLAGGVALRVDVGAGLGIVGQVFAGPLPTDTAQRDSVRKMQDRAQDSHQQGFRESTSNVPDKMFRP
ncbi:MAG TPA: T9SS type A sorting domain-containing protein [Chthoniobacterales bacterium]|nr:T9SS type A sorting domain-containing protein [Chthoniobacterales bacterium]